MILPFSSVEFFKFATVCVAVLHLAQGVLRRWVSFQLLVSILSIGYILVYLKPYRTHLFGFTAFQYIVLMTFVFLQKRRLMWVSMSLVVTPLFLYKLHVLDHWVQIVGLSFMTFRAVQVLADCRQMPGLLAYTSFMLYFPSILAGPLVRFERFEESLEKGYAQLSFMNLSQGWRTLVRGILCKFIVAELLARLVLSKLDSQSTAFLDMCKNAVGYSAFLYFEFAGYSLMAIGLSQMFGVTLPANFRFPFLAQNPRDFWRRWHISLGEWLKDYVFSPSYRFLHKFEFTRSRPLLRQNLALFATFQTMGIWNGLGPKYLLEGALFGFYSIAHNSYSAYFGGSARDPFSYLPANFARGIKIVLMFVCACFGLYVFSGRFPFLHD